MKPQELLQQIADSGMPGSLYAQLCLTELAELEEKRAQRRKRYRRTLARWIVFTIFSVGLAIYSIWRLNNAF